MTGLHPPNSIDKKPPPHFNLRDAIEMIVYLPIFVFAYWFIWRYTCGFPYVLTPEAQKYHRKKEMNNCIDCYNPTTSSCFSCARPMCKECQLDDDAGKCIECCVNEPKNR